MRHARDSDLDKLEPLLVAIRERAGLKERKRGIFYYRAQAFLHFHEHEGELIADLRADQGFTRFVLTDGQDELLLSALDARLKG